MNFRKIVACILSCAVIGASLPYTPHILPVTEVLASEEAEYTEGTYELLTYKNYGNYIEISGCDIATTEIEIPAEIEGIPVTVIGEAAFASCRSLKSITLPDSITSIENNAFYLCERLKSITIPSGITSISDYTFSCCYSLANVTIPDSVTSIGKSAFQNCQKFTDITIPDGITSISDYAFGSCTKLTNITIPDSVTEIGSYAFYHCDSLANITIPDSVTSIGGGAFSYCSSLTNITIHDSVKSIGSYAFYNSALTSIDIPYSIEIIDEQAFKDCTDLTEINVNESNANYSSVDGVLFNKDKTLLITYPTGKTDAEYTIPESVTDLSSYAFSGCKNPASITLPDNITAINDYVFTDFTGLTSITLPDNITSIGEHAFRGCESLTSIIIPDSVTSIGECAFSSCSSLANIIIPESVTSIGDAAFYKTPWLDTQRANNPLVIINNILIDGTTCQGDVTIPDGVTEIKGNAFDRCDGLTGISIPDSVTSIGEGAFSECTGLESVIIPYSVTSIGYAAFSDCYSLKTIHILNPICKIAKYYGKVYSPESTINNGISDGSHYYTGIIYGYADSTAQSYANVCGYTFATLNDASPESGDANGNGIVEVADAVFIMQGIADPGNQDFVLSESGKIAANCKNPNDSGIDSEDALAIQMFMAELIPSLPAE